ncbi:TetR/AcrR family transcriptional regulator [Nocardia sp. NPDC050406]|uniref:TetR/AcrR family transcriptional regulator n=1 Tax=Nocardia sp. NPDC050406 TaxID=3364318 RepID=UPI0037B4B555
MPRLVDHEQRRREITDAVRRVVATRGLEAATFQSVAAEAGISVRLVQYYFGTKKEFLRATHQAVVVDSGQRFAHALTELGEGASPRATLRAILLALLPLDEASRRDTIVLGVFNLAARTGEGMSTDELMGPPKYLVAMIAEQLTRARALDPTVSMDPALDAELAVAAMGGLTQGLASGYGTPDLAIPLVDRLLDHLFGPGH